MTRQSTVRYGSADPTLHATVAHALEWLRRHAAASANLVSDSRAVQAGDVFVAYAVDGADSRPHILNAVERGAVAVLYQPDGYPASKLKQANTPALPLAHLDQLAGPIAAAWYGEPSEALQLIGITGTNGKTSCSHWIAQALAAAGVPSAIVGTLGSGFPGKLVATGFTTPNAPQLQRSLAELRDAGARAVSMEVSSHALHQGRVNGTAFDIAVFTNLSQDHLDYHGTLAAYEAAKATLFRWPGLRHAVINRDDAAGRRLLKQVRGHVSAIAYGLESCADAQGQKHGKKPGQAKDQAKDQAHSKTPGEKHLSASAIHATPHGTAFTLHSDWGNAEVEVATLGEFNVSNLLAVLGTLLAADIPFDVALAQLAALAPVEGRMQRVGGRGQHSEPLVVIDYAHTPDALEKTLLALRSVAQQRAGQLICVFGCGGDRDATKRPLMGAIAERLADQVVLTSDNPRSEPAAAIIDQIAAGMREPAQARRVEDRAIAILQAIRAASSDDLIVLAGKGHEATQEIAGKKRPFSDHDHALLALAARATQTRGDAE
jgi:UDP-N-acetylmuramoyl-L-alanyl-D-glutamate--2,6-diaminopimelate ligase